MQTVEVSELFKIFFTLIPLCAVIYSSLWQKVAINFIVDTFKLHDSEGSTLYTSVYNV